MLVATVTAVPGDGDRLPRLCWVRGLGFVSTFSDCTRVRPGEAGAPFEVAPSPTAAAIPACAVTVPGSAECDCAWRPWAKPGIAAEAFCTTPRCGELRDGAGAACMPEWYPAIVPAVLPAAPRGRWTLEVPGTTLEVRCCVGDGERLSRGTPSGTTAGRTRAVEETVPRVIGEAPDW
mmetsp:Transcript_22296/g.66430  ORF Transcript_22296/g.66430 Transcript_22296/m.66430 type:complete len:177 (+) Transcript_22296:286-816(+)